MISRVALVCLLLALVPGAACEDTSLRAREEHVLNRIGYGPDPWSRQRIRELGIDGYIEEQLHPERISEPALESRLEAAYPALTMSLSALRGVYNEYMSSAPQPSEIRPQLGEAKLLRAVESKRQLEQVLVDFWFNHFNVDARSEIARWAVVPYERDVLRPLALGRFEDLLLASARHPAMLEFLDNAQNFREGFVRSGQSYGVNENYARELLELHTVGPDAGQTLADVRNVARALTGWTVSLLILGDDDGFAFVRDGHDDGPKTILNSLSLSAGRGIEDGEAVLRFLARHPLTAFHVSDKLCRRFVSETPTSCQVAATLRFLETGGNIREVMRTILLSDEFLDPIHYRTKAKRPLHVVASFARTLGVSDEATFAHEGLRLITLMGEDLYGTGSPMGLPEDSSAWAGEGFFIARTNLAWYGARGAYGLVPVGPPASLEPVALANEMTARLLHAAPFPSTRSALIDHLRAAYNATRADQAASSLLASPDFAAH